MCIEEQTSQDNNHMRDWLEVAGVQYGVSMVWMMDWLDIEKMI